MNFTLINPNYLGDFQPIYLPYMILNFFGIVLGTLGNLTILLTIAFDKNLNKNPAYMFMFNLALADISISIFVDGFTNIGIIYNAQFFWDRMGLCVFLSSFCLIACGTSLVNMGFLAINRYVNICHHRKYAKFFSRKNTVVFCVLAWLAGIVIDLPNFFGWGGHFFDIKSANCMWNRLASHSYSIFFPTTAIFIPCVLIFFCYFRIYLFAKRSRVFPNKVVVLLLSDTNRSRQSFRVAISSFASFALFTVCWLPYGVMITVDFVDIMPMSIHVAFTFMAHFNSAMNPILYFYFNPAFRMSIKHHYTRLIKRHFTRAQIWTMTK